MQSLGIAVRQCRGRRGDFIDVVGMVCIEIGRTIKETLWISKVDVGLLTDGNVSYEHVLEAYTVRK